jgi:hypothetical protein
MKRINRLMAVTAALTCGAWADPIVTFTLDPSGGLLAGAAGTSVGWGYTISTDSDYVTLESFTFGDSTPVGIFSTPGVPFTTASVGSPITTPWIQDITGLQYDISAAAIVGASTQGVMTVVYDAYTDPGLTNQIVFGQSLNAQSDSVDVLAEVDVSGSSAPSTPEPGSVALLGSGLGLVLLLRLWVSRTESVTRDLKPKQQPLSFTSIP